MKLLTVSQARSALSKTFWLIMTCTTLSVQALDFDTDHCFDDNDPLDPLMIDLGQDGFQLGNEGEGVMFDLFANGDPVHMQWTAVNGNEAFVVLDKNGNGLADNGSEMLTNYNPLILENRVAPNGFVDLAQYDNPQLGGNNDGYITIDDQVWQEMLLWLDSNADGIATPEEMLSPASVGITRLDIIPKENNRVDPAGNLLPLWAWAKNDNHQGNNKYKMIDVLFKPLE